MNSSKIGYLWVIYLITAQNAFTFLSLGFYFCLQMVTTLSRLLRRSKDMQKDFGMVKVLFVWKSKYM